MIRLHSAQFGIGGNYYYSHPICVCFVIYGFHFLTVCDISQHIGLSISRVSGATAENICVDVCINIVMNSDSQFKTSKLSHGTGFSVSIRSDAEKFT